MTYGVNKRRNIARDSLASPRQSYAKFAKAGANRRNRHTVKAALCSHREEFKEEALYPDSDFDAENYGYAKMARSDFRYQEEIKEAMWDRRHDNLGCVFRYGNRHLENVPNENLATEVYKLFPDNVAGRHAAGHLLTYVTHERNWSEYSTGWGSPAAVKARSDRRWLLNCLAALYLECLTEVVDSGRVREFNIRMGWAYATDRLYFTKFGESRLTTRNSIQRVFLSNCGALPPGFRQIRFRGGPLYEVLTQMGFSLPEEV